MYYLGWDIGIKNLAYCIVNEESIIKEINIIKLIDEELHICSCNNKNGKKCTHKAIFKDKIGKNYCKRHSTDVKGLKKIKIKKCKNYSLEELGRNLFKKLDENSLFLDCEHIIIENQPVLKNPTMKSLQIMLYSYFLLKNKKMQSIQLVNACNKLKVYKGSLPTELEVKIKKIKDKYRKNKMLAIEHAKIMMEKQPDVLEYFSSHKKQDDLADAFLMCKYLVNKIINI